jgi:hypothetical protein
MNGYSDHLVNGESIQLVGQTMLLFRFVCKVFPSWWYHLIAPDLRQIGLHTCFHVHDVHPTNYTMLDNHINDIKLLMAGVRQAVDEHHLRTGQPKTIVIIVNGGRPSYGPEVSDCSWKFGRVATLEAHKHGFVVLERQEMERRLLYRSEHNEQYRNLKPILHLEMPAQSIIATALAGLISCVMKNTTKADFHPFSVFRPPGMA